MPSSEFRVTSHLFDALAPSRLRVEMRDTSIVNDQVTIAQIAAPTGDESRRAAWIAKRLCTAGLKVSIDAAGNVIGICRGATTAAPIVVCAHLDTVFTNDVPLGIRQDQGRWIGPGIGDNARGLATMAALADEFGGPLRPARPIVFAATTGEEGAGDLRGARYLFGSVGQGAHAAIAIDGAGDERIVSHALGCRRYRVGYQGPGGHSWAAFGTPNAIHAAAGLVARLTALPLPNRPRSTLTVSRIGGGTAVNAIPSEGWIDVDMRSASDTELAHLDGQLHAAARAALDEENARARAGTSILVLHITLTSHRPAGDVPDREPLVLAACEATRCVGRTPELAVASTDANIPMSLGIPAVAIGGGGKGGDTHTTHEWFENVQGSAGVFRALVLLALAAGLETS
jgi:tripeptide aminopeptidase